MSYKLKEQVCKHYGTNLPIDVAYHPLTRVNTSNAVALANEITQAYNEGKEYFVMPMAYLPDGCENYRVVLKLNDDWFEEEHDLFVPDEYTWYKIDFACACEIADDDTILVRNWLGKIEIAKNKDELLKCNKTLIPEFMIINSDVPF